jgi:hypothetical protein
MWFCHPMNFSHKSFTQKNGSFRNFSFCSKTFFSSEKIFGGKSATSKKRAVKKRDESQEQGCQMVYFQTKIANLGKFWRALVSKRLV